MLPLGAATPEKSEEFVPARGMVTVLPVLLSEVLPESVSVTIPSALSPDGSGIDAVPLDAAEVLESLDP